MSRFSLIMFSTKLLLRIFEKPLLQAFSKRYRYGTARLDPLPSFVMFEATMVGSSEREVHRCSLQRAALVERRIAQSTKPSAEHQVPHVAAKTSVLTCTSSNVPDTSRERRCSLFPPAGKQPQTQLPRRISAASTSPMAVRSCTRPVLSIYVNGFVLELSTMRSSSI